MEVLQTGQESEVSLGETKCSEVEHGGSVPVWEDAKANSHPL